MARGKKPTILIDGQSFREISKRYGIRETTLRARYRPGITVRELVNSTKCGRNPKDFRAAGDMTLSEIAADAGLSYNTVYWRYRNGFTTYAELTAGLYEIRGTKKKNGDKT